MASNIAALDAHQDESGGGRWVDDPFALPIARGEPLRLPSRLPRDLPLKAARAWVKAQPRPWAVDLFAGAGDSVSGFTVQA